MIRRDWEQLPSAVQRAIERECGPVVAAETLSGGINSPFAAVLWTDRKLFCKGIAADHPHARMYHDEIKVNRYLPRSIAPSFVCAILEGGWIMLVFEHVDGTHPGFSAGSTDLVRIAAKISTMGLELADIPSTVGNPLGPNMEKFHVWRRFSEGSISSDGLDKWVLVNLALLVEWEARAPHGVGGDALLHADLNAGNILFSEEDVYFLDWACASRGAPWVDVAYTVPRLIASGHSPQCAEEWARRIPAWGAAPDSAVTAFAVAMAGIGEYRSRQGVVTARALVASSREWVRYRLGLTT
ncbi:MAG: phosphotransferase [Pseudonocardiaceae bacterium]